MTEQHPIIARAQARRSVIMRTMGAALPHASGGTGTDPELGAELVKIDALLAELNTGRIGFIDNPVDLDGVDW